jgi:hypothetical protein
MACYNEIPCISNLFPQTVLLTSALSPKRSKCFYGYAPEGKELWDVFNSYIIYMHSLSISKIIIYGLRFMYCHVILRWLLRLCWAELLKMTVIDVLVRGVCGSVC